MALHPPAGLRQHFKHLEHPNAELVDFHAFLRDRFRSGPEAAAYLGGPAGHEARLNAEEFARAIRMSGYPQPPSHWDSIFMHAGNGTTVLVADLLRGSGLPVQHAGVTVQRPALSPVVQPRVVAEAPRIVERTVEPRGRSPVTRLVSDGRPLAASQSYAMPSRRDEDPPVYSYGIREEVTALRQEVASLDVATRNAATVQELETELRNREIEVAPLRSTIQKLEESTTALRGDSSDTRAALVETRRSLAEERSERQGEVTTISGRLQEIRKFAEDRASRESQTREVQLTEFDTRWRGIMNEEKQQRLADNDALSRQVQEEMRTRQSESQLLGNRLDELREALRVGIAEEARTRLSETQMLNSRLEEVREVVRIGLADAAAAKEAVERAMGDRIALVEQRFRDECAKFLDRMREECAAREAADRDGESQRVDLQDQVLRTSQVVDELRIQAGQRFDEERRERMEADRATAVATAEATEQALQCMREEAAHAEEQAMQGLQRLGTIISEESERRNAADQTIAARMAEDEGNLQSEKTERNENDRALAGRLTEIDADLSQFHYTVMQSLKRLEELPEGLLRLNSDVAQLSRKESADIYQVTQEERQDQRAISQVASAEAEDRRMIKQIARAEGDDRCAISNVASEVRDDTRAISKVVSGDDRRAISNVASECRDARHAISKVVCKVSADRRARGSVQGTADMRIIDSAAHDVSAARRLPSNAYAGASLSEVAADRRAIASSLPQALSRRPSPERTFSPPPAVADLCKRTPPPLDRWSLPRDRITKMTTGSSVQFGYNWNSCGTWGDNRRVV